MTTDKYDLNLLATQITNVQDALQAQAAHAVNLSLTARNWLIGCYIVEYEQNGEDRAQYGDALLKQLAKRIKRKGLGERRLYEFRQLYRTYPSLGKMVIPYLQRSVSTEKLRSATAISGQVLSEDEKLRLPSAISPAIAAEPWQTAEEQLFYRLSASHLLYLSNIKEPLRRAFYEQEAIDGCWTIKELDRQVSSLYFERMGMSKDKIGLRRIARKGEVRLLPQDIVHDPVALEFLNLEAGAIVTESKLETAILNQLQHFLLEMGKGFCFEARQKRILVDQDYFKADLVFYHRILKCHVIIDLKIDRFRHEYASQLNFYLNYFRHEVMQADDNPPIGLLLCADYSDTSVRYATEGLSHNLFVSKYKLQLPTEEEIKDYLLKNVPLNELAEENTKGGDK